MDKYISKEKLSKKAQREIHSQNRLTWGLVNPVTQKIENKRAYNRKKVQKGFNEYSLSEPFLVLHFNAS